MYNKILDKVLETFVWFRGIEPRTTWVQKSILAPNMVLYSDNRNLALGELKVKVMEGMKVIRYFRSPGPFRLEGLMSTFPSWQV